jgi:hypothetical protein
VRMRFPLESLFSILLLAAAAFAQSANGTISGLVLDPSGSAIVGAEILVANDQTGIKYPGTTNGNGIYAIASLPPGSYRLQVSKPGFKTLIKPDIVLNVQDALAINFTLPVGALAETVTVVGGAPLVNTQDGSVSTVVDRRFVENMPLNGRSFQTLITLTPGVTLTPTTYASQGQFSVNGQRADANYFTVDGASANVGIASGSQLVQSAGGSLPGFSVQGGTNSLVSVDAMQEFRVQTSSFAPEFGRSPGGQISIATRSGTDAFHGTVFDYFRNDALDASDWFNNAQVPTLPKAKDRQNDFGGVLGGPIIKDKTFFFFSYEGLRLLQPRTGEILVPDVASRQQAPAGVQPYLNAFPVPNGANVSGGLAAFSSSYSNQSTLDAYGIRVDHKINQSLSLFGRYNYAPSSVDSRQTTSLSSVTRNSSTLHTLTLGLDASLASNISNELRANYSNARGSGFSHLDDFGNATPLPQGLLFPPGLSAANSNLGFLILGAGTSTSGVGALLVGKTAKNEQRQLNAIDNLSVAAHNHLMKFGVDYRWLSPIAGNPAYQQSLFFLGVSGGAGFAMSGDALAATITAYQRDVTLLSRNFSLYAQDVWRMNSRFTLTYGLRWDVDPALGGKGRDSQPFTVTNFNDPANMGLAPRGTSLYQTTYGNVAPRIGVAYQLRDKQGWESVLRGGAGIFYDFTSGSLGNFAFDFPFTGSQTLFFAPLPLTAQQAAPPVINQSLPATGLLWVAPPHLALPRTYQWNVGLEQSMGGSQSISVTYVGAVGRKLLRGDSFIPNPNFAGVIATRNTATSDYHALQAKYQRRLSRGIQALASYTWAHSIDISSNDSLVSTTPSLIGDPGIDRGDSDFDVRHTFTAALSYDLPSPSQRGFLRPIFGSWSLDNFVTVRSSLPVDLVATSTIFNGAAYDVRPDLVSGQPLYLRGAQCAAVFHALGVLNANQGCPGGQGFNPAAFATPTAGQQGDLRRNTLRGFGAWQDDFTIRRQIFLREKVGLQFRAEFFNIFNHPNFGPPTNTVSDPQFGLSTQTLASSLGSGAGSGGLSPLYQIGAARSIQLALKLSF